MQLSDLDFSKTYSYADYLQWTFEDRLELIKGKIFKMTPAPNLYHQDISAVVSNEIFNYLKGKPCKVYVAPFDVRLPRKADNTNEKIYTVVQPDICVICDLKKLDKRGCIGAPDVVIEILSPGNNQKELNSKYDVYEESGVLEYWLISPQDKSFLQYKLVEGKYQSSRLMTLDAIITTPILPGFELNLNTVFEGIE
jgi:Uma2 family endonuclease